MAREDLHFRLRIPEELKRQIESASVEKGRSMTAEIIERLEHSFQDPLLLPSSMIERIERRSHEQRIPVRALILQAIDDAFPTGYRLGEFYEMWAMRAAKEPSKVDRRRIIEMANEHPESIAAGLRLEEKPTDSGIPVIAVLQVGWSNDYRRILGAAYVLDPLKET